MHTPKGLARMAGLNSLGLGPAQEVAGSTKSRFYVPIEIGSDGEPHEIRKRPKPVATIRVAPKHGKKK